MDTSISDLYRSTHQFVLAQIHESTLTYQELAERTGMSRRTIEKIARKEIETPSPEGLDTLAAFFRSLEKSA